MDEILDHCRILEVLFEHEVNVLDFDVACAKETRNTMHHFVAEVFHAILVAVYPGCEAMSLDLRCTIWPL